MPNKADQAAATELSTFSFEFPDLVWRERYLWDPVALAQEKRPQTIADLARSSGRPAYEIWQELLALVELSRDVVVAWQQAQDASFRSDQRRFDLRPAAVRDQQPWPWAEAHSGAAWRAALPSAGEALIVVSDRPEQAYSAALWLRANGYPESCCSWPKP